MLMIHLGLTGFRLKKGCLFGMHSSVKIWTLDAGIIKFQFIDESESSLFRDAVSGLSSDPEWLLKNRSDFERLVDQKSAESISMAMKNSVLSRKIAAKAEHENMRLRTEIHTLKCAIKIVQGDGSPE
jgi:hypothetical protein